MEIAVDIWNALWDNQIEIAVFFVFLIWMVVRGGDVLRWIWRKLRANGKNPVGERESSAEDKPISK